MDRHTFNRWNSLTGWAVFAIAAVTYLWTMEPSSSLWDCAEFIAVSYKLEVGHPPGAPLFMLLARIATMFAPSVHYVPHMVNAMNALASAFCILFMFWTITHIARRLCEKDGEQLTVSTAVAVLGAGAVGALAYTFTDTFWFSAVEGEVYALSSMFTALVVWLMLKWEEEADSPHAMRWIVLIAYCMGLSIGVHIPNLLTIPALVFIYYFRTHRRITFKGICLVSLIAGAILLLINGIIIPNTVYITHKRGRPLLNLLAVSVTMIMLGFSSYATITIRAAVNPPMNSNNPDNPAALLSMLNREQYGNAPLLYGASYSAPIESYTEQSFYHFDKSTGKYVKRTKIDEYTYPPQFMHLFPRMWNYMKSERDYKPWAAYRTKMDFVRDDDGEIVRDEQDRPIRREVLD